MIPVSARVVLRAGCVGILGFAMLGVAVAADAVIMRDGFVITGRVTKERNLRGYSFDVVDDGPKVIIYSAHSRKGGKVEKNVPRPEYTAYKRAGRVGNSPPPAAGEFHAGDFDEHWRRTLEVRRPDGNYHEVKQLITYLDPYACQVDATSHRWRLAYHTSEMDPDQILRLLRNHPDLKEEEGKPDLAKRLAIVQFLKDTGWLAAARRELESLPKLIPGNWPADQVERSDKLREELDTAETKYIIDELEAALKSGRYETASRYLAGYSPKSKDPAEITRLSVVKAQIETIRPKFEQTAHLLDDLLDRVEGGRAIHAAVGGGLAVIAVPRRKLAEPLATLVEAGHAVLQDLHPDSASRIELFRASAQQEMRRLNEGKKPINTPEQLLALAVTGWLKGSFGAETKPDSAVNCWKTRELAIAYFREDIGNQRRQMLDNYLSAGNALPPSELAQVISLLPPPFPEDLSQPLGVEVKVADSDVRGIYKRETGTSIDAANAGVPFFLHLPPEYHHGRSYPLLIGLTHTTVPAEKLAALLAPNCDRNGYILATIDWTNQFDTDGYDISGSKHPLVTSVLRDLLRRFQIDPDKVFLFGLGEGATFAFDMGASHPDLFAGVSTFGGMPKAEQFMHYWRNTQKLPYFVVTGEHGGGSVEQLRKVFEYWMPRGFPALMTMYKGRGVEWYTVEVGRMFDWMGRQTRARGTASLRLNEPLFEPWQILRPTDNRFYWVGTTDVKPAHQMSGRTIRNGLSPAHIAADIQQGNKIIVKVFGVRNVVIWLERNMIDWTRPVGVILNGQVPYGFRPHVMEPDLHLMFETLYRNQDRKMLFMGRFEFPVP